MKKIISLSFLFLFFFFFFVNYAEARSGCCSHHGGVCGCGCCDGTPLSATCAPYYPSCNNPVDEPEYVEETKTVEESNNDAPVYKAAAVMSSVESNNADVVSPIIDNSQTNNMEVKEIVPLSDESEQALNLDDSVDKIENDTKTEQTPLAPAQSNQIPVNENKTNENDDGGFWGGLVFWGAVGYVIYLVKKKKSNKKITTLKGGNN